MGESLEELYEIRNVLGTGGFSEVRFGISKIDRTEVAIKTIRKHSGNEMANSLLKNELFVMTQIEEYLFPHPNLIHVIDVFETNDHIHLVLEYCSGGELFDRIIKQERYSENGAAAVIRQITTGIKALHEKGISHHDLKPENCLFLSPEENSPLKLIDFGLSHVKGFENPNLSLFGSLEYVSPEVLQRTSVTPASDMWSLGVILYILLCGSPPFHDPVIQNKKNLICSGNFTFSDSIWTSVSEEVKQLIKSLLSVDANQRPTAQQILHHPWVKGDAARLEPMSSSVSRNLCKFNARQKFRSAVFASILSQKLKSPDKKLQKLMQMNKLDALNVKELERLLCTFREVSSNGTSVSLMEFVLVLSRLDMVHLSPFAGRIFELFDYNKNGSVDFQEIVRGLSMLRNARGDDALELCFKIYDADNSGYLSKEELSLVLRALPEYAGALYNLDDLFNHMDANKDGKISFEEFKPFLKGGHFLIDNLLDSQSDSMAFFR